MGRTENKFPGNGELLLQPLSRILLVCVYTTKYHISEVERVGFVGEVRGLARERKITATIYDGGFLSCRGGCHLALCSKADDLECSRMG